MYVNEYVITVRLPDLGFFKRMKGFFVRQFTNNLLLKHSNVYVLALCTLQA